MHILLSFLMILAKMDNPKMALIILRVNANQNYIDNYQQSFDEKLKELKEWCENFPSYPTCEPTKYFEKIIVTRSVSTALQSIPSDIDTVYISANRLSGSVNLNGLPSKMVVTLTISSVGTTSLLEDYPSNFFDTFVKTMVQVSYNGSMQSQIALANAFSSHERKTKAKYENEVDLYGKIDSKVSFLIVMGFMVNIVGHDLNCENVYFSSCSFGYTNYGIKTKYLIADPTTSKSITYEDGINVVSQYCILDTDEDYSFRVSYKDSQWVLGRAYLSGSYMDVTTVTYNMADKFCLITYGISLNVFKDSSELSYPKPLNVTIMEEIKNNRPYLSDEKKKFVITESAWGSSKKPEISVVYDKKTITVEMSGKELDDKDDEEDDEKLIKNICIAAIVVACVIAIVVVIVVIVCVRKKKMMKNAEKDSIGENSPDQTNEDI